MQLRPRLTRPSRRGTAALLALGVASAGVVIVVRGGFAPGTPDTVPLVLPGVTLTTDSPASPSGDPTGSGPAPATSTTGGTPADGTGTPPPVRPVVHRLPLQADGDAPLRVAPRGTERFSLVGATWANRGDVLATHLEVRTRDAATGTWRPWEPLVPDDEFPDGADGAGQVRGGTTPVWAGESDGVEVRTTGTAGGRLPAGLRLELVDPGRGTTTVTPTPSVTTAPTTRPAATVTGRRAHADTATSPTSPTRPNLSVPVTAMEALAAPAISAAVAAPAPTPTPTSRTSGSPSPSPSPKPTPTPTPTPKPTPTPTPSPTPSPTPESPTGPTPPPIVSRAGWQADESIRRAAPQYATAARVVFVHHTAGSNSYSCSDSPSIVRSLYAYHTLGLGWNDIGYNFLVDKCGTIFEGRYGGTTRAVIGAHTYGFNTGTTGISVIGTYTGTAPSSAVLTSVARLAAWKLSLAGMSPTGTTTLVEAASDSSGFTGGRSYSFRTISGHRDGYATECPGSALYAQLPLIRSLAAAGGGPSGPVVTVSGAGAAGGRYYTTGRVTVSWSAPVTSSTVAGYTVLVDGRALTTTSPGTRSAALALAPGTHVIAVRTTYLPVPTTTPAVPAPAATTTPAPTTPTAAPVTSGTPATGSPGPTPTPTPTPAVLDSVPVTVVADVTAPAFTSAPRLGLRTGTVNNTGIPVAVTWQASDNAYLAHVTASSPVPATFAPGTTRWDATVVPGDRRYTLTAVDGAGNSRGASVTGRTTLVAETTATRQGSWSTTRNSSHLDGSALSSAVRGSVISWSFTGTAVSWIATRTKASGQAVVYLDGVNAGTVDLRSAYTSYRQSVWARSGLTAKRHTVTVVVGTAGRPTVVTDGITYLS